MNWIKARELNLQPLVIWITRQRTEVVLLLAQFCVGVYVAVLLIPAALDRQERIANQMEQHHTEQVKEIGKQYQADQSRDARERELLIQKLFGQAHREGDPSIASQP